MTKIFISHSSKNKKFIRNLKKHFPDKDYPVWLSFEDIKPGKDTGDKIKKKLSECDFIIFILTDEALKSPYVNQEIGFTVAFGNKEIIPVIDYDKNQLPGFLYGKDALKLYINSPKKTFLEISPYLRNKDLQKKPSIDETEDVKNFVLTYTGYNMWISILSNMEKGPTPISSFAGSYTSYLKREQPGKNMIDKRLKTFSDFFLDTKLVEPIDLEEMKEHVYSHEDLKGWKSHLNMPVIYRLSENGKSLLKKWKKLEPGDTYTLTVKKTK